MGFNNKHVLELKTELQDSSPSNGQPLCSIWYMLIYKEKSLTLWGLVKNTPIQIYMGANTSQSGIPEMKRKDGLYITKRYLLEHKHLLHRISKINTHVQVPYSQISNISCTKSQNLNVSRLVMHYVYLELGSKTLACRGCSLKTNLWGVASRYKIQHPEKKKEIFNTLRARQLAIILQAFSNPLSWKEEKCCTHIWFEFLPRDNMQALFQIMAQQVTSHYLNKWWLISLMHFGVTQIRV